MVDALWPAILLASVAGFVDALGYVGLAHLFTANLTGNAAAIDRESRNASRLDPVRRSTSPGPQSPRPAT